MKDRLRNQPVTVRPRVTVNGDAFRVDYYGTLVKEHCGTGFPTFEKAIEYANSVARRNPTAVTLIREGEAATRRAIKEQAWQTELRKDARGRLELTLWNPKEAAA